MEDVVLCLLRSIICNPGCGEWHWATLTRPACPFRFKCGTTSSMQVLLTRLTHVLISCCSYAAYSTASLRVSSVATCQALKGTHPEPHAM